MSIEFWQIGEREIVPRYAFLETLFASRRVLEIGAVAATAGRSARFLKERGAREVVAFDDDADAVVQAREDPDVQIDGLEFRTDDVTEAGDAFDLILVHTEVDPESVEALKGMLAPAGRLALVLRGEGPSLSGDSGLPDPAREELIARLQQQFAVVEWATQTALLGYALTLRDVELPPALDESYWTGVVPAYEVIVCGDEPSGIDAAALMSFPCEFGPAPAALDEAVEAAAAEDVAETEAPEPPEPVAEPEAPPPPPPQPDSLTGLVAALDHDLQDDKVRELQNRLQGSFDDMQKAELAAAQAMAERDHLRSEVEARTAEVQRLKREVKSLAQARDRVQEEAAEATRKAAKHAKKAAEAKESIEQRDRLLEERAEALAARDRLLDERAETLAARDRELTTARARIAELEREVERLRTTPPAAPAEGNGEDQPHPTDPKPS